MIVLLLGSGPGVVACRDWPRGIIDKIVTINNAWAVRPDWNYLVHPDDFPEERHPPALRADQRLITSNDYVPVNNDYGGIIYAGGTMAFSAGYWALGALRPKVLAYLGCDMIYGNGRTHFYGKGTADPLRSDPTLQNLRAKSARLELLAARQGCSVVNLSASKTRLTFPTVSLNDLAGITAREVSPKAIAAPLAAEQKLNAYCPSGRYWQGAPLDAQALARIDAMWIAAHQSLAALERMHASEADAEPKLVARRRI